MAKKTVPNKIIAPVYEHIFERKNLLLLVDKQQPTPIIWINGAPGSGKTVFVASLLKKRQAKFLWYRMDGNENNLEDIFYFLTLAAKENYPRKKLKLPVFTAEYEGNIENFARIFFRQLFACLIQESAIVLDNCQGIEKVEGFYQLLLIAVNELPDNLQLICISRNRLASELSRLRLNSELLEIGGADLQFNDQESKLFLNWLNPQLNEHQLSSVQLKTQGWVAGMVLLTETLTSKTDQKITDNFNDHEAIFNYLITEMLNHANKELSDFLIQCALFSQLTIKMGEELTGCRETKTFLNDLISRNFLIERTSGAAPIYRFHPLFRDLLLDKAKNYFAKEELRLIQQKAAKILIKQDCVIEALGIYQQLQDWSSLKELLLQQSDELIKTGRYHSVSQWMAALPNSYVEEDTWLNYWNAVALKVVDPSSAAIILDKCYQQFLAKNDIYGAYSAWQAAVESITISMDDYSMLEVWLNRFEELRKNHPSCPSFSLKTQFYATAVQALSFYNPQHSWLRGLIKIIEGVLRLTPVRIVKIMLSIQLGHYYVMTCQLTKLQTISTYLKSGLNDKTLPTIPRIMSAYILAIQAQYVAKADEALAYSDQGLELSEESGIYLFKDMLLTHKISSHIINKDIINAEKATQKAFDAGNVKQRMSVAMRYSYSAWLEALKGNKSYALEQNQQALQLTKAINVEVGYICSLALKAQLLAEMAEWKKAEQTFSLLLATIKDSNNRFNLTQLYLTDAWLAYLQQDQTRLLLAVQQFFQLLQSEQMLTFFGWRPEVITPLCIFSLENSIEKEFVVHLVKTGQLFAKPPLELENWPWPVRIYSFGSLHIEIAGKLLDQSGKSQKKILEFLSAIIALGGKNVNSDQLGEMLWPDADGDLVKKSVETALHRLRKLIGKQAVLLNSGTISLNDSYCWLDLWAFEVTTNKLEQVFKHDNQHHLAVKLTDRLLNLYQGTFLKDTNSALAILKREQLQNKLHQLLDLTASSHEQLEEYELASRLLKKGVELEPLLEENYLRLISHYIKQKQPDQAMSIYQQCYQTLYKKFDIPLSDEIELCIKQLQIQDKDPN